MLRIRTRMSKAAALVAVTAGLATAGALGTATPAQAAFTGPAVQLLPQNQSGPFHGLKVLTADGNSVGDKVRAAGNGFSGKQKWHYRFNGGSVAQIINDESGLCMKGASVDGWTIRLATCVDPNRIDLSESERQQFWNDRQRLLNGVVVHRLENVVTGKPMGVRTSGSPIGILEMETLNGQPNQLFRNQLI